MAVLKVFFVVFLFIFTIGEIGRFDLDNGFSIKIIDIFAFIIIFFWLLLNKKSAINKILKDPLSLPLILFAVIGFVSLLVNIKNLSSNEAVISLSYLIRWLMYLSLYYVVSSFTWNFKKKIIWMLVILGAIIVTLGYVQYFFYSTLLNLYYLDWDNHMYRLFSTFLDPNFAGAFLVLYLIYLMGILLQFYKNKKRKLSFLTSVLFLLTLPAIYLTFSRSALIMLFVSSLVFCILVKKLKWMIILTAISIAVIFLSSKNFNVENINLFRVASTEARLDSARTATQIIKDNLLIGVGFNGYKYAQIRYGFRHRANAIHSHADSGTDNSFLFILATTGIIGIVSYLYLLLVMIKRSYSSYKFYQGKEINQIISIVIIASLFGVIADSFFINSLFYSFIMIWLWILLGLMENKKL